MHTLSLRSLSLFLTVALFACGEDAPQDPKPDSGTPPKACDHHLGCASSQLCQKKVCVEAAGLRHDLGGGAHALLVLDARAGTFDLYSPKKTLLLRGAHVHAALDSHKKELRSAALSSPKVSAAQGKDELGGHRAITAAWTRDGLTLTWRAAYYKKSGAFVFRAGIKNGTSAAVTVNKLTPVRARGSAGGGLFLGQHPRTHRILENGAGGMTDQYAALVMADKDKDAVTQMAPGKLEGYSASNWSHLIWDSVSGRHWMAGALTTRAAITVMNTTYDETAEVKATDGRIGFSFYSLEALYLPKGKPIKAGGELSSEHFYIQPTPAGVHQALEAFAQATHDKRKLNTWTDRGLRVPNGWNSWAGSGGTGGYGTAIDQTLMEKNLAVMRDYLRDFGMDYFQMDDGWELDYGDWTINSKRFPDGFSPKKGIVKSTLDAKMKPGIWIAAFSAYTSSQLYKTYYPKGWFMPPTIYGKVILSEYKMLDLSNPAVQAWLKALFTRVHDDWGFRWLKLDFSYPALLCQDFYDPTLTNVEVYDLGLDIVRKAMGSDSFFLNIGSVGIGMADGKRVTLDNAPVWDWDPDATSLPMGRQGFKPTMATTARRYFYQGKVWITHPDLIIFRSDTKNLKLPRVTFEEARAFSAFVAATGGIVKLGDRMVEDLAPYPKRINVIRQLLPIHPQPARPLDLMTREFPEQWFKKIEKTLGGYKEAYGWYLVMNLGLNWDYTQNPAKEMADDGKARTYTLDPAAQGLEVTSYHVFELWEQKHLGLKTGKLTVTVPSHDSRVYALRPKLDHPQLLGHNRHVTMGAAVLEGVAWDKAASTLTMTMDAARANKAAPFVYSFSFHGNGRAFDSVSFAAPKPEGVTTVEKDGVLRVQLTPTKTGPLKMVIKYK